jgi:hypothetical protein
MTRNFWASGKARMPSSASYSPSMIHMLSPVGAQNHLGAVHRPSAASLP